MSAGGGRLATTVLLLGFVLSCVVTLLYCTVRYLGAQARCSPRNPRMKGWRPCPTQGATASGPWEMDTESCSWCARAQVWWAFFCVWSAVLCAVRVACRQTAVVVGSGRVEEGGRGWERVSEWVGVAMRGEQNELVKRLTG